MDLPPPVRPSNKFISVWNEIFPWASLLEASRLPLLRGILIFALFPLAASIYFSNYVDIQKAAWVVGIYFAVLWAYLIRTLLQCDVKKRHVIIPALFTPIVGIPLVLFLQKFPIIKQLYDATEIQWDGLRLIGFVGGVGVLEEAAKILPVLWLAFQAREIRNSKEAAFCAAISGLAFGIAEAASYSLLYAQQNAQFSQETGLSGSGNYILWQFLRTITLPLLHAAFSGTVGYYVGLALSRTTKRYTWVILGLLVGAVLHGLYDFFSSGWLGLVIAGISIWFFIGVARSKPLAVVIETISP